MVMLILANFMTYGLSVLLTLLTNGILLVDTYMSYLKIPVSFRS